MTQLHHNKSNSLTRWSRDKNGRHFADDTFKRIFLNENIKIPITISLKFVPRGSINSIPALVQKMAWRRPGDKPLSEPMVVRLPTHICVTRPQWVNPLTHWKREFHLTKNVFFYQCHIHAQSVKPINMLTHWKRKFHITQMLPDTNATFMDIVSTRLAC